MGKRKRGGNTCNVATPKQCPSDRRFAARRKSTPIAPASVPATRQDAWRCARRKPRRSNSVLIYLDTIIVIYAVEIPAVFGASAQSRLQAISRSDHIALSPLTRMECCNHPLRHRQLCPAAPVRRILFAFGCNDSANQQPGFPPCNRDPGHARLCHGGRHPSRHSRRECL